MSEQDIGKQWAEHAQRVRDLEEAIARLGFERANARDVACLTCGATVHEGIGDTKWLELHHSWHESEAR